MPVPVHREPAPGSGGASHGVIPGQSGFLPASYTELQEPDWLEDSGPLHDVAAPFSPRPGRHYELEPPFLERLTERTLATFGIHQGPAQDSASVEESPIGEWEDVFSALGAVGGRFLDPHERNLLVERFAGLRRVEFERFLGRLASLRDRWFLERAIDVLVRRGAAQSGVLVEWLSRPGTAEFHEMVLTALAWLGDDVPEAAREQLTEALNDLMSSHDIALREAAYSATKALPAEQRRILLEQAVVHESEPNLVDELNELLYDAGA